VAETIERARRYREAGADGIFVPKVVEPEAIRAIASAVELPLNVLAWPGLAPPGELAALGVRRLSAGSMLAQAAWNHTATLAADFLRDGRCEPPRDGVITYAEINARFA
jgi:2-methylisocitrate lyase-like PEP mutase family enzyme